ALVGVSHVDRVFAQEGASLASHPLTGTWAALTEGGVVPQIHGADGSFIAAFPPNYIDPMTGLTFQGSGLGRWEPTGEHSGRFTFLQALATPDGAFLGSFQLAAEIEVSEDGQRWSGTTPPRAILRDATNAVVFDQVLPLPTPVTGVRIGTSIDSLILPEATPVAVPES
ncbi:MAG: hypothetical protein KC442_06205, partial [Thermomicrobiales bacterium]|nr:hypothetical protein [Thermomicrobiales bacterium]